MSTLLYTQNEVMLQDAAHGFLAGVAPVGHFRGLRDAGKTHDAKLWAEMAQTGWTSVSVSKVAGGSDMGHAAAGVLAQEMGKTLVTSPFLSKAVIAATALRQVATERANAALAQIALGKVMYASAVDEGHKHNPEATTLSAVADGNGFRLNGSKGFVVDGGNADRILVLAQADAGLTLFDLPADRDGLVRTTASMIDARDAANIDFNNVHATGEDIVGVVGDGMTILRPALEARQAALAVELAGLAAGAFEMTISYLKECKQFGVEIGCFLTLQHRAAHLWCESEVTASAVRNAGRLRDEDPESATMVVSLAKSRATQSAKLAVLEGVQLHGGIGMTDAFDMGFNMKRARVAAEWLGDYGYQAKRVAAARGF